MLPVRDPQAATRDTRRTMVIATGTMVIITVTGIIVIDIEAREAGDIADGKSLQAGELLALFLHSYDGDRLTSKLVVLRSNADRAMNNLP